MGDSASSMFYLFALIIVIYLAGSGLYSLIEYIKERRDSSKGKRTDG